jgi:AcrR family transcriptional regulator
MSTVTAEPLRRGRGRPRTPEVTEAIVSATIELLAEGGVEAVTIEAIAARAGVGRPSIYRRWASLEALIGDVMALAAERDLPIPDTGSLRSDLVKLLEDFVVAMSEPLGRASAALVAYATTHPEVAQDSPAQERRRRVTRVIVERAKDRGELARGADADHIMDLVVAPVWMTMLVWRRPLSTIDANAIVDTVLDGALPRSG